VLEGQRIGSADRTGLMAIGHRVEKGVATLTLARPSARNALTLEMIEALHAELDRIEGDPSVRMVVLRGEGDHFCAGADIKELLRSIEAGTPQADHFLAREYALDLRLAKLAVPLVVVADGVTMGGGLGLAFGGYLVATPRTRFAMPESRIGFLPDIGATYELKRRLGPALARYFFWTADSFTGEEALRWGFAEALVAPEDIDALLESLGRAARGENGKRVNGSAGAVFLHARVAGGVPARQGRWTQRPARTADDARVRFARRHFERTAPPDVRASLERAARGADDTLERDWARETLAQVARRSPASIWASDLLLQLDYEAMAREAAEGSPSGRERLGYLRDALGRAEVEAAWLADEFRSMPRGLALACEYLFATALFRHPDFAEGARAFREKREPEFPSAGEPLGIHRALFRERAGWALLRHAARLARDAFWIEIARQELDWMKPPRQGHDDTAFPCVRWFGDGTLNASAEALDRWVERGRGAQPAFIWEGDRIDSERRPLEQRTISYGGLLREVQRCAAALRALGLRKGDSLVLYMPNTIETYAVQLAAARIGAVYHPVFAGFARQELSDRLHLMGARVLVTVDGAFRKGEVVQYKRDYVDPALRDFVPVDRAAALAGAALARHGADPDGAVLARFREVLADTITVEKSKARALLARELLARQASAAGPRHGEGEPAGDALPAAIDAAKAGADLEALLLSGGAGDAAAPRFIERLDRAAARLDRQAAIESGEILAEEEALPSRLQPALREFAAGLEQVPSAVRTVVVLRGLETRNEADWVAGRDLSYEEFLERAGAASSQAEPMGAEDPLFVMFTSGSTGKPKGVVHTHGGYLARLPFLLRVLFGLGRDQRILTVADPGWITGQSFACWGPLTYGMTSVLAGFVPVEDRLWSAIERYRVHFLKTGVTGIRASMGDDPGHIRAHDLSSLRHRSGDATLAALRNEIERHGRGLQPGHAGSRRRVALASLSRGVIDAHQSLWKGNPADWPAIFEEAIARAEARPVEDLLDPLRDRVRDLARDAAREERRYTSCSCAEPLDAAVQAWWEAHIGPMQNCWWRTEDGGPETGADPAAFAQSPDASARPLPWADLGVFVIRDDDGNPVPPRPAEPGEKGTVFVRHNPGIARGTWARPADGPGGGGDWRADPRFREIYHADVPGWHNTGDAAVARPDGALTFLGRDDEVLNVSGHRVGTQEIEGAVRAHAAVANVAAIGIPAEIKGDNPVLFVTLRAGQHHTGLLDNQLREAVSEAKGSHVAPSSDFIFYVPGLPTTKSGKILRRFLKYAAALDRDLLGSILGRLRDERLRQGLAAGDRETLQALFPPLLRQGRTMHLGSVATVDRMGVLIDVLLSVARRRELDVDDIAAAGRLDVAAPAPAQDAAAGGESPACRPFEAAPGEIYALGRTDFRPGVDPLPLAQEAWAMVRDAHGRPVHGEPKEALRLVVEPAPRDPEPNEVIVQNLFGGSTHNVLHALLADPTSPFEWHRQPYHVLGSGAVCRVVLCGREVERQGLFSPGQLAITFPATYRALDPKVSEDAMHAGFEIQGFETPGGTLRPFDRLQATQLLPVPKGLTLEQAASFMLNLVTVYRALTRKLQLHPGQRLLVEGATGGTGAHAVDIGTMLGARVTGIVGSPARGRQALEAGASGFLDRNEARVKDLWKPVPDDPTGWSDWERSGTPLLEALRAANDGALADAVVSFTGRDAFGRLVQMLAPGGRLVFFGAFGGYCLRFLGKGQDRPDFPSGASRPVSTTPPGEMLERAGLRPGMGVLVHYGAGAAAPIARATAARVEDPLGLAAIQAALDRKARVVALTHSDAQSAFIHHEPSVGPRLLGTISLESLRRGSRFEWPDRMPDSDRDRKRYEHYETFTLKPLATAVGRLLRSPGETRGQPDLVVARGSEDTLAADLFMVRPFTGAVVYAESCARAYTLYAPQVWMRQRRILFPTFEILGTHMGNPQQGREVIDWIGQGLLPLRPPRVVEAREAPAAFQAMHENAAGGPFVVHLTAPGRGLTTEREIDERNGAIFFDEKYVTVRLDALPGRPEHLARVTLRGEAGRPPTLARDAVYQIGDAFRRLAGDRRVCAVVLTGEGSVAFLAGQDLRQLYDEVQDAGAALTIARDAQRIFDAIESFPRPVIAVVNGVALGGGHELLSCAHYRIAVRSPRVRVGQPEIELGIIPGFAGTQRLTRLLIDRLGIERGLGEALEMILNGRHYDVDEARALGLFEEVVEGNALQRACALAGEHARGADRPLAAAREGRLRARQAWRRPVDLPDQLLDGDVRLRHLLKQALDPGIGRGVPAVRAVEAVLHGLRHGFEAGCDREARLFASLVVDERHGRRGIRRFLDRREPAPLPPPRPRTLSADEGR
jgi:acrylyl-CoA reductase (NADPH)/3-hydroxypropionyl-CoA dehydratase/3-hydroxypropionyl-CoA synthetase